MVFCNIPKRVYAISLEGSLKMKEISYIHSEAYAAGELKHGTISLIEDGTLVIGVLTQFELYEKIFPTWWISREIWQRALQALGSVPINAE